MAKRKRNVKTQPGDHNVPLNGAEAYKAGLSAADCPYSEEYDNEEFNRWNEEWDNAAEEATSAEESGEESGEQAAEDGGEGGDEGDEEVDKSVVKAEYRARYAEAGHPAHCGDELAVLINNLCLAKAGFDIPRFEIICAANDVDLSKYNRTTNGWQGRLRMTGRNVLAGKVFANGGVVKTPNLEGAEAEYKLSAEWMASRRKPKVEAA